MEANLTIIDYSERALALIGETKPLAEQLKSLGGRFNPRLSCGPGWIFSKKVSDALKALVGGTPQPTPRTKENPLNGARVYVGTYRKYASGSIAGAWLNLIDYKDKDEFLKACRELHKDEKDPEFMFQDWEGVPSWMIGESHIDAEVWEQKPEVNNGKQSKEEIRRLLSEALTKSTSVDYYASTTDAVLKIDGKFYMLEKPTIETRFCHPDEPEDEVREWRKRVRTYEYFRDSNLSEIDSKIKMLEDEKLGYELSTINGTAIGGLFIFRDYNGTWRFGCNSTRFHLDNTATQEKMTDSTRRQLLKEYKAYRARFEKRLASWWKRYGADKLHCWTYWQDA